MNLKHLILASALGMAATPAFAEVTYLPQAKVDAALAGKASLYLHVDKDVIVEGCYRDKPGEPEVHEQLLDTFYITAGGATFVAGGKLEGGKAIGPGQIRGGKIVGGTTYHLVKGDVIVIPAGVPHQFAEVPASVSYYVVKPVPK
jgi:mannose-6-phosphate isomerase-like protein (cupin superfamily)